MNTKTLKAFAVVGEGYGDTPEQLEVAATDGVQLAVFATSPAATDRIEFQGEEVREVVIVPAADFNRVTAERDALQLRLNAADERTDELSGMLQELIDNPFRFTETFRTRIAAALNPKEIERDQGIPGTSFQRLNTLANQGE
ncbi:hypothetical protein [Pseudomonas sp. Sample_24]|uniref:hypothetical protein n=1 Tax=Pseudomonas sp. Sample_24 TaxID=2448268 RepID=UPI001032B5F7|nr:hypothetical protein [Pseudomonas sp. Sample_24]